MPCLFVRATEDALICSPIDRGLIRTMPERITFDRRKVREVRKERSDEANAAAGGAIGAATGATLGALRSNNGRGFGAYVGGAFGLLIGEAFGRNFHVLHGPVVYRR